MGTVPSAEFQQPSEGLQPNVPVMLAGMRQDPPVSEQKPADAPCTPKLCLCLRCSQAGLPGKHGLGAVSMACNLEISDEQAEVGVG